jgi:hypothetical protein
MVSVPSSGINPICLQMFSTAMERKPRQLQAVRCGRKVGAKIWQKINNILTQH